MTSKDNGFRPSSSASEKVSKRRMEHLPARDCDILCINKKFCEPARTNRPGLIRIQVHIHLYIREHFGSPFYFIQYHVAVKLSQKSLGIFQDKTSNI